jgi:hypothetical protein
MVLSPGYGLEGEVFKGIFAGIPAGVPEGPDKVPAPVPAIRPPACADKYFHTHHGEPVTWFSVSQHDSSTGYQQEVINNIVILL